MNSSIANICICLLVFLGQDSALFWHYAMRHVPSDSLVCASSATKQTTVLPKGSKLQFSVDAGLNASDPNLLLQAGSNSIPLYGYAAFSIGSSSGGCMCGWSSVSGKCQIPADACAAIFSSADCAYDPKADADKISAILQAMPARKGSWACPDMDFSDSWGIVPIRNAEDWILLPTAAAAPPSVVSARLSDVIRGGRAGLRIGNIKTMPLLATEKLDPSQRSEKHPLGEAVLQRCAGDILSTFDAQSFANSVVDDLFPAAQAVGTESWPVSACLRFAIEYSRLRVLKALGKLGRSSEAQRQQQEAVVAAWKHKCESQLGMLAVCKGNGIMEMIPPTMKEHNCSFQIMDDYASKTYYVGPASCLVYVASTNAFYDPCMHPARPCNQRGMQYTIAEILARTDATRIRFDVRSLLSSDGQVLGTWPIQFFGTDDEKNEMAAAYADMLEEFRTSGTSGVPWRLSQEFADRILSAQDEDPTVGNTRKPWHSAEGFASASTDFCDGIADWWPEDWTKPVGYHVTVPCSKDEAGYRVFDAAFAVDRNDGTMDVVKVKYQHTMMRDQEAYHSRLVFYFSFSHHFTTNPSDTSFLFFSCIFFFCFHVNVVSCQTRACTAGTAAAAAAARVHPLREAAPAPACTRRKTRASPPCFCTAGARTPASGGSCTPGTPTCRRASPQASSAAAERSLPACTARTCRPPCTREPPCSRRWHCSCKGARTHRTRSGTTPCPAGGRTPSSCGVGSTAPRRRPCSGRPACTRFSDAARRAARRSIIIRPPLQLRLSRGSPPPQQEQQRT